MCTLPHTHLTIDSSKLFYSYEHPKRIATSRLLKSQSEFSGSDYLMGIESRATLSNRSASKVDLPIQHRLGPNTGEPKGERGRTGSF